MPLDSWVYPALRRLASLGYAPDLESLVAPWTRQQCFSIVRDAEDIASRRSTKLSAGTLNDEALRLIRSLATEFASEAEAPDALRVESVYGRFGQISGPPLRDGYHFGQTITNDFGRPYGTGANSIGGFSGYGTLGRFSAYFRGEYQQAAAIAPYSQAVQNFIANLDGVPGQAVSRPAAGNRFDTLEMYVGAQLGIFNVSVGKQALWWGPGQESAFHFSNNAEPMYMARVAQTMPILLPGPFRFLGRIRTEFLVGRLTGHQFPPRPFLNAQKITFQLTQNLEVGFTRSSIFGGEGHPLTIGSFARSMFSVSGNGTGGDPGDRRSGFDFRWYLPGLRRTVTLYSDSLADDEPNPLANPKRSAWAPGIYFTHLPRLPKLDLRFETYSTWLYRKDEGGRFIYWNNQYQDAYTNDKNVIGSWVGRDARAYAASSTYWISPQKKLTASFRQTKTGSNFLPGGGTQTDAGIQATWQVARDWTVSAFSQYERYYIPVLGGPQHNVTGGFEVTFYPKDWQWKR